MDGWMDWLQSLFVAQTLGVMLWIGLALLSLTLFVLMRSRWGQVKPLWKCVVLSVLAHVLLGGYAYGTKLIFQIRKTTEKATPVSVILDDEFQDEVPKQGESGEPGQRPHWEQFATGSFSANTSDEPKKMAAQVSYESTRPLLDEPQLQVRKITGDFEPVQQSSHSNFQPQKSEAHQIKEAQVQAQQASVNKRSEPRQNDQANSLSEVESAQLSTDHVIELNRPELDISKSIQNQQSRLDSLKNNRDSWPNQTAKIQHSNLEFDTLGRQSQTESKRDPTAVAFSHQPAKLRRLGDGQPMPKIYQQRSAENRKRAALANGATAESEQAVARALKWLAENQKLDGRWDASAAGAGIEKKVLGHDRHGAGAQADTGITGLALLAFLGAGNTHLEGEYQDTVRKGLQFLMQSQFKDGSLQGDSKLFARMYCHGMALLALSEAYSMTGDAELKRHLIPGVNYSIRAQNLNDGGWRYQPGDQGDMSQFGWQVMALTSARNGGIEIDDRVIRGMHGFLNACSSGRYGGLAAYRPRERASATMTAEAMVCRCFLGVQLSEELIQEATRKIRSEQSGQVNFYYWYYATMALHQTGGQEWDNWHRTLRDRLVEMQRTDGYDAGSWDANGVWSGYGGRVYSTAMSTLCLEIYYRYLPLIKQR